MKVLILVLLVFLFLLILCFFSSLTGSFTKIVDNKTDYFYLLGKVEIEEGKISFFNTSVY
ncbi:MAG: hypothetical protein NZ942_00165 [Candidatus Aenigmarchaeota archaeon]|nr:hypothetical protein [Candidatus Aenigmarchaeota archaeon]